MSLNKPSSPESHSHVNLLIEQKLTNWKHSVHQDLAPIERQTMATEFIDFLRDLPEEYKSLKVRFTLSPDGADDYLLEDRDDQEKILQPGENGEYEFTILTPRLPHLKSTNVHGSANRVNYFAKGSIDTIELLRSRGQLPNDIFALVFRPHFIGGLATRKEGEIDITLNPSQISQIEATTELPHYLSQSESQMVATVYS